MRVWHEDEEDVRHGERHTKSFDGRITHFNENSHYIQHSATEMETERRRSVRVNRRWMNEEREKHPKIEPNSTRNCKCRRWRQSVYVTGHKIIYLSISFSDSLTPFVLAHWHTYFEFGQSFTVRCHSGSRWCQTFLRYFNAVVASSLTLLSHSHTIQWHIRFSVCFFSVVFRPCVCVSNSSERLWAIGRSGSCRSQKKWIGRKIKC